MRDSYFLPFLTLGIFLPGRQRRHLLLPAVLFATFVLMYAPAGRVGGQYELMLLPWLAWLTAEGGFARLPIQPASWFARSAAVALLAVCLVQYFPVRTHGVEPPPETFEILRLIKEQGIRRMVHDMSPSSPSDYLECPLCVVRRYGSRIWGSEREYDFRGSDQGVRPYPRARGPLYPERGARLKKSRLVFSIGTFPSHPVAILRPQIVPLFLIEDIGQWPLPPSPEKPMASQSSTAPEARPESRETP